jgi:hypothetical protein
MKYVLLTEYTSVPGFSDTILNDRVTIVGACIEHDLVAVSPFTSKTYKNVTDGLWKSFVFDEDNTPPIGPLIIIKTDDEGIPIDLDYEEYEKLFKKKNKKKT